MASESAATAKRAAEQKASGSRLLRILLDAWTVSSSIVDIVTDVLVLLQFYEGGSDSKPYFLGSLVIFLLATSAYSLLFCSTYAKPSLCVTGRVFLFLLVLPVSQLVPVFTWIESFHFRIVDKLLHQTQILQPTTQSPTQNDGVDQLWTFVRENYARHAGFMAEAIVEALPQAALQTYAAVKLGGMVTPVTIASVLMSCLVLASKGYVISYSIDRKVCLFNSMCVAADLFGAFASVCWLGSELTIHGQLLVWSAVSATFLLVAGAFTAFVFIICDDHLKQWRHQKTSRPDHSMAWFDLYIVRSLVFLCGLIPLVASFLVSRLILIPLAVLGSLDPEHARHHSFYDYIFHRWLTTEVNDLRIDALNDVLDAAKRSAPALQRALGRPNFFNDVNDDEIRKKWTLALASPEEWRVSQLKRHANFRHRASPLTAASFDLDDDSSDSDVILRTRKKAPPTKPQKSRFPQTRKLLREVWVDVVDRSDILSYFEEDTRGFPSGGAPPRLSLTWYPAQTLLVVVGSSALAMGTFLFIIFVPMAFIFHLLALTYAPMQLILLSNRHPLAVALTVALLIAAAPLFLLSKRVHHFRSVRDRLTDSRDLPPTIYDDLRFRGVVARRYLAKVAHRRIQRSLVVHTSADVAAYILDFLGPTFFKRDGLKLWTLCCDEPEEDSSDDVSH